MVVTIPEASGGKSPEALAYSLQVLLSWQSETEPQIESCAKGNGAKNRQDEWTGSIAVGSRSFIEDVKSFLGFRARGRAVMEGNEGYQLRENTAHYKALFVAEKDDIGPENSYLWNIKYE